MRRSVGVGRAIKARKERAAFQEKGAAITEANLEHVQTQLAEFKQRLETFAVKHRKQISKDPEFRSKFQAMCAKVGVDPLASSKGFWAEMLGVGRFYYELSVQTLHVCLATREANGGLIELAELVAYLRRIRARHGKDDQQVTEDDVRRAIDTLEPLGSGTRLVQVGAKKMLVSVPLELSADHTGVLALAQEAGGFTSSEALCARLGWTADRADRALAALLSQGMAWIDEADGAPPAYWFPAMRLTLL